MKIKIFIITFYFTFTYSPYDYVGYGKNTTGGRGGNVYHVTNLNDSGVGSIRDAIENGARPRTVVFDISGEINLLSRLSIRVEDGDLTIAGETAPAGGITIRGASMWIIGSSNIIMSHIRLRPGIGWAPDLGGPPPGDPNYEPDDALKVVAFTGETTSNLYLKNCSISWGRDGIIDFETKTGSTISDITVEHCLIYENVDKHYSILASSGLGTFENITFYRNALAHNNDRNIATNTRGGAFEKINNVVYYEERAAWFAKATTADVIGNVYRQNPDDPRVSSSTFTLNNIEGLLVEDTSVFFSDNTDDGVPATVIAALAVYAAPSRKYGANGTPVIPSSQVMGAVLPVVGAYLYRDAADTRVINDIINLTGGVINSEVEVGGYPVIASNTRGASYDTDADGMPDVWEVANGLNPLVADNNLTNLAGSPVTNLEVYLGSLVSITPPSTNRARKQNAITLINN
jgi:hypothetical protein